MEECKGYAEYEQIQEGELYYVKREHQHCWRQGDCKQSSFESADVEGR